MQQRFVQRDIGILEVHVLAHHGHVHLRLRTGFGFHHALPFREVGRRHVQPQFLDDDVVKSLLLEHHGNLVQVIDIPGRYDCPLLNVGEQGYLGPLLRRDRVLGTANQYVWLNADGTQLFHGVLGGFGLNLGGSRNVGDQGKVHVGDTMTPQLDTHLANGLEERQGLDIAHGAPNLDHAHVSAL